SADKHNGEQHQPEHNDLPERSGPRSLGCHSEHPRIALLNEKKPRTVCPPRLPRLRPASLAHPVGSTEEGGSAPLAYSGRNRSQAASYSSADQGRWEATRGHAVLISGGSVQRNFAIFAAIRAASGRTSNDDYC